MKHLLPFSIMILLAVAAPSVTAQTNYQRIYSDRSGYFGPDIEWSAVDQTYVMTNVDSTSVSLSKLDPAGVPLWNKKFSFADVALGYSAKVVVASDGTIYLCTNYDNIFSGNMVSYLLMAVNQWGTHLWSKVYETQSPIMYDEPQLNILPDGNLIIVESVAGHMGYIKTDLSGNLIASNMYREDMQTENKTPGFDGAAFADGSMIFTGKHGSDIMVVRTNSHGIVAWTKVMNGGMNYYHTKSVAALWDGSSIMTGMENNGAFIMRMDADGNIMWYKSYTGTSPYGTFYDVQQLNAGSFVTVGYLGNASMLATFDLNGQILSAVQMDSANYSVYGGTHLCVASDQSIAWPFMMFDSLTWTQYKGGLHIMSTVNSNGCNVFPLSFQADPVVQVPVELSATIYTIPQTLNVYAVAPTEAMPGIVMNNFCWLVGAEEPQLSVSAGLTLNASVVTQGSTLNFSVHDYTGDVAYAIHDMQGRSVAGGKLESSNGNTLSIPLVSTFANGMYVLSVQAGESRLAEKFIVQ